MRTIDQARCTRCGGCASVCPTMSIVIRETGAAIVAACIDCGSCEAFCPVSACAKKIEGS